MSDWQPNICDCPAGDLITIDSQHWDACLRRLSKGDLAGVHISAMSRYAEKDLEFLRDFPNITAVAISYGKGIDLAGLQYLKGLQYLTLDTYKGPPDLGQFSKLRTLSAEWSPQLSPDERNEQLENLTLFKYKCPRSDLSCLPVVPSLKHLELNLSAITSLEGVERQRHVQSLHFYRFAKLTRIADITSLSGGSLQLVKFELCKKIEDIDQLGQLESVKKMTLDRCADIKDLEFLRGCSQLEEFVILDTKILSGDLRPLLDLPKLRYFCTSDKRHHSHSKAEINALLRSR
ncbi:hypothetical protein Pla52o_51100 [Novipirellula galeiformis]|uniref:Leucine Rich repeats (2 copies) n=1 Tax=Novipirellula galeiformis TaxID=2528004 RepID=A0A5C6C2S4_9BACT|nr:hypothetical protein [Novipirellula galeiformis]TWU17554.1 hypothetical protein Pla52o_51100 [Novipirellula galeiformis]